MNKWSKNFPKETGHYWIAYRLTRHKRIKHILIFIDQDGAFRLPGFKDLIFYNSKSKKHTTCIFSTWGYAKVIPVKFKFLQFFDRQVNFVPDFSKKDLPTL